MPRKKKETKEVAYTKATGVAIPETKRVKSVASETPASTVRVRGRQRGPSNANGPSKRNPAPIHKAWITDMQDKLAAITKLEGDYTRKLTAAWWIVCGLITDELARTMQTQSKLAESLDRSQTWVSQKIAALRKGLAMYKGEPKSHDDRLQFLAWVNGNELTKPATVSEILWRDRLHRYVDSMLRDVSPDELRDALLNEADRVTQ